VRAGSLNFEGEGPFYLRAIETATASVLDETVQLTLYAQIENRGQGLVQIETQMTPHAAQELANYLLRAVDRARE
jgi:hypothetical protein